MGKGLDKQGREPKKKKNAKQTTAEVPSNAQFRHHSVVTSQPETPPRTTE